MRKKRRKQSINLGVAALARELNIAQSTVSKKMSEGASADQIRIWAAMRDGREPPKPAAAAKSKVSTPPVTVTTPLPPLPEPEDSEYDLIIRGREMLEQIEEAKLRRARALAERQELDNMEKRGELLPIAYVRKWGAYHLIQFRDELRKGPSELSDALAVETDPVKCGEIIRAWLERANAKLEGLQMLWANVVDQEKVA